MQPTQQGVVPYNFVGALLEEGTITVDLPASFDFIITSISAGLGAAGSTLVLTLMWEAGGYMFQQNAIPAAAGDAPAAIWAPELYLGSQESFNVELGGSAAVVNISGYALWPQASEFLPA